VEENGFNVERTRSVPKKVPQKRVTKGKNTVSCRAKGKNRMLIGRRKNTQARKGGPNKRERTRPGKRRVPSKGRRKSNNQEEVKMELAPSKKRREKSWLQKGKEGDIPMVSAGRRAKEQRVDRSSRKCGNALGGESRSRTRCGG